MGAIPTSDLPGHRQLHERVVAALDRCQESQSIDFKESAAWEDLKWHVVHSVLAMGNLRDGGVIVIGVSQRGDQWDLTGIESGHLGTYDVDVVTDQINKHVSPHAGLDVVLVEHASRKFLAVNVREFEDTPLVCKKNGPDGIKAAHPLKEGCLFVRPPGMARTTRVMNADQMRDLLQLAAEKRARRILEASHRIGMEARATDKERFQQEAASLWSAAASLPVPVVKSPHWRVEVRPERYEAELLPSLSDCLKLVEQTKISLRGWDFPHLSNRKTEQGRGKNWIASWASFLDEREYWRLYQSGQFIHLHAIEEAINASLHESLRQLLHNHVVQFERINWDEVPGFISYKNFLYRVTEIFEFAARICQHGVYKGPVRVAICLRDIKGFALSFGPRRQEYLAASESELGHDWTVDSAELVSASAERSLEATAWFLERFGWLHPRLDIVREDQRNFLDRRI